MNGNMAFDPTVGGPNANSYNTVQEFRDYATERGIDIGPVTDAVIEGWLIRATEFLDGNWAGEFKGTITNEDQALSWPRENVVDCEGRELADDAIPLEVKNATNELAREAKDRPNLYNYVTTAGVTSTSSQVGSLRTSQTFKEGQVQTFPYTNIGRLLHCVLSTGFNLGSSGVIRT